MQSALRATAMLGTSSVITILVGLISAKGWAVLLGASGLGLMGLFQGIVGLGALIAGIGIGPGLVRAGAAAIARDDLSAVTALRRAATLLAMITGLAITFVFIVFREELSRIVLGTPGHGQEVALLSIAVLLTLAASVQASTLNAYHRVSAMAKLGVLNSVISTGIGLAIVTVAGDSDLVVAVAIIAMVSVTWATSRYFLVKEIGPPQAPASMQAVVGEARALLRFGGPYTASQLVGTGVQIALPILVLHVLSQDAVGFQRAAMAVSVVYIGFLLNAMAQDYYPRVSAASHDSNRLHELANEQHRLILMLGAPVVVGMMALAPILVPLMYTGEFRPAVGILEWQLMADVFKLSSWTISFVILARAGSVPYFVIESIGGVSLLLGTLLGMHWFETDGIGIGFLISFFLYWAITLIVARRMIGLYWSWANWRLLLGTVIAVALIRTLPVLGAGTYRTPLAIAIAIAIGLNSARMLANELGGMRAIWVRFADRSSEGYVPH